MPSYLEGIPLLQYVHDITFCKEGSAEEARNLTILLYLFADFSGLQINHAKSIFLGFGPSQVKGIQCSKVLGTPIRRLEMRCLLWKGIYTDE